jgi:FkbM family methyltransferase
VKPQSLVAELVPPQLFVRLVALQYRFFEPELRHLDAFVPLGKTAVDVGAWWGPWSWWLARRAFEVHAFEPNKTIYDALRTALPDNVDLHNVALSDHRTEATLWSPAGGRGTEGRSSLLPDGHETWLQQPVETAVLDEFDLTNVGFVKIDVEGHELAVLRGASKLIERERPNVFVEVDQALHSGDDIEDVFSYFTERNYAGSFFAQRDWLPLGVFDRDEARRDAERNKSTGMLRATLVPSKRHIHNFLFRPRNSNPPLRPLT